eukprot:GHVT01045167.1.p1 GENE.GHVT01045167.1~~GHVT01045167.1.p1  ORF type:complete len:151 (+),score=2.00 GHVT01045167.1:2-454(+)
MAFPYPFASTLTARSRVLGKPYCDSISKALVPFSSIVAWFFILVSASAVSGLSQARLGLSCPALAVLLPQELRTNSNLIRRSTRCAPFRVFERGLSPVTCSSKPVTPKALTETLFISSPDWGRESLPPGFVCAISRQYLLGFFLCMVGTE